ncbi:hypothetical protein K490DRAFT_64536 [Saccharata proteae CBS 121410]|uniref:Uncharacterized protein n=1 Tax=Saccharata proteae CBS 121410 TaxID=1314787 RepID=A0A9P4LZV0_9PEZI|nr:hypothetical protein K490DRAFT_64536 [Saccharata proteae CBS 121410]
MCISYKRIFRCGHVYRDNIVFQCGQQEQYFGHDCSIMEGYMTVRETCPKCLLEQEVVHGVRRETPAEEEEEQEQEETFTVTLAQINYLAGRDSEDEAEGDAEQSSQTQSPEPSIPGPSTPHNMAPLQQLPPLQPLATHQPMAHARPVPPQAVEPQSYDPELFDPQLYDHLFDPPFTPQELDLETINPQLPGLPDLALPQPAGPQAPQTSALPAQLTPRWSAPQQNVPHPWTPRSAAFLPHQMPTETTLPGIGFLGFQETGEPSVPNERKHHK